MTNELERLLGPTVVGLLAPIVGGEDGAASARIVVGPLGERIGGVGVTAGAVVAGTKALLLLFLGVSGRDGPLIVRCERVLGVGCAAGAVPAVCGAIVKVGFGVTGAKELRPVIWRESGCEVRLSSGEVRVPAAGLVVPEAGKCGR